MTVACDLSLSVPRETVAKLERYAALLIDWQTRINLVGPSTLPILWDRHFIDSLQLVPLAHPGQRWLDIGAGAGFPGLVIAVAEPASHVTLVESITKKCNFLKAVVSELSLQDRVKIENRRIETLPAQTFDVVTARALAPLSQLFDWGMTFAGPETLWILPKGARVAEEISDAKRRFDFRHTLVESRTDAAGRIVVAHHVSRK